MNLVEPLLAFQAELQAIRRDLHAHPELAFAEFETTSFLEQRLREAGLQPRRLPCGNFVTASPSRTGACTIWPLMNGKNFSSSFPPIRLRPKRIIISACANCC